MVIAISTAAAMLLMAAVILLCFSREDIVKIIILAFVFFWGAFVIISGVFFGLDIFSFQRVLFTEICIEILCIIYLFMKGKRPVVSADYKSWIIPLSITLVMLPFTAGKFEFFGLGQDQGAYQTKAIFLMSGITENQIDFEEYEVLPEEKENFEASLFSLGGLDDYNPEYFWNTEEKEISEVSSTFHGIPTFAAMLGLWGSIFGIANMAHVQTLFYICYIFMVSFAADRFRLKWGAKLLAVFACAWCPAVIWVSKSALTEMFLAVLLVAYLYFMAGREEKSPVFATFFLAVFAFYHVSIYTLLPVFILLAYLLYIKTKNKIYLKSAAATVLAYYVSLWFMLNISAGYTLNQYKSICVGVLDWRDSSLMICITAVCAAVFFITLFFIIWRGTEGAAKKAEHLAHAIRLPWIAAAGTAGGVLLYFLTSKTEFPFKAMAGYVYLTGFVLGPVALGAAVYYLARWKKEADVKMTVLISLFFYCILFHTVFLRRQVEYYYYYSRYLVPFVAIVILLAACILNRIKWYYSLAGAVVIGAVLAPFNKVFIKNVDDTRMEWDVLEGIADSIDGGNSAVIVAPEMARTAFLPVRAITGADTFFQGTSLEEEIQTLKQDYDKVYYITGQNTLLEGSEIVYRDTTHMQEDKGAFLGKMVPLPRYFDKDEADVYVYEIAADIKYEYNMNDSSGFARSGFGTLEGDSRWINSQMAYVECTLPKDRYKLSIYQGPGIPFSALKKEELSLEIYLNGVLVGSTTLSDSTNGQVLTYDISRELVSEGENVLSIKSELWNASGFSESDNRKLGISVTRIVFEK